MEVGKQTVRFCKECEKYMDVIVTKSINDNLQFATCTKGHLVQINKYSNFN